MNGIRVCILVFLALDCLADKLPLVRGHIESSGTFFGNELVVELHCQSQAAPGMQTSVNSDGWFEFRDVNSGMYMLRALRTIKAAFSRSSLLTSSLTQTNCR